MKLTLHEQGVRYRIRSYDDGAVQVNDERLTQSFVVGPGRLVRHWPPTCIEQLTWTHLQSALELEPEILLLGTGPRHRFPAQSLLRQGAAQGVGIEVLTTAAACRTYTVLSAEGRSVAAAILLPG